MSILLNHIQQPVGENGHDRFPHDFAEKGIISFIPPEDVDGDGRVNRGDLVPPESRNVEPETII